MTKRVVARRLEHATYGLLVAWVGVLMAITERDGVDLAGAGAILLGSALVQLILGRVNAVFFIAGGVLAWLGIDDLYNLDDIPAPAIVVIVIGALMFFNALRGNDD